MFWKRPFQIFRNPDNGVKRFFFLFLILVFSATSLSNRSADYHNFKIKQSGAAAINWKLDATLSGVEFYHAIMECNGRNVVFLRLNNKNNYKVAVSWKEEFATRQLENRTAGHSGRKQMVLFPGETLQENCSSTQCEDCLIVPEKAIPSYKADIIDFAYKDITVNNI